MPENDPNPATPGQSPVAEPKPVDNAEAIKQAVDAALAAERKANAEKATKEKEAADEAAAKEQGKWKELAEKAEAKRVEAENGNRRLRQSLALRDYLADKHPAYIASAIDIAPQIPADADGDALADAVKKTVEGFVARNPRETKPQHVGAPVVRPSGARVPASRQPNRMSDDHAANAADVLLGRRR